MFDAPAAQIYYQLLSTNLSNNYLIGFSIYCVVVCYSSEIYRVAIKCNYKWFRRYFTISAKSQLLNHISSPAGCTSSWTMSPPRDLSVANIWCLPKLPRCYASPPWTCGKAQALPVMAAFPSVCCHYPPGQGRPSPCGAETVSQSIMCRILIRLHLHCFCRSPPGPLFTVCQRQRLKRPDIIHGGNANRRRSLFELTGRWG